MATTTSPAVAALLAAVLLTALGAAGGVASAARPAATPGRADADVMARVTRAFADRCAVCHGADGRGGERGPDIITAPRASSRPLAEIERIITEGVPAGGMPPSGLPAREVAELARHVRALASAGRTPITFPHVRATRRDGVVVEGWFSARTLATSTW